MVMLVEKAAVTCNPAGVAGAVTGGLEVVTGSHPAKTIIPSTSTSPVSNNPVFFATFNVSFFIKSSFL
jgi:hypothetical protein